MRYFLPSRSTRMATSDIPIASVFNPIVKILEDFVFEPDKPSFALPPIIAAILQRNQRRHEDGGLACEHSAQHPPRAAGREYLGGHDDAARTTARRPRAERLSLLVGVRHVGAKAFDSRVGHAEFDQD